MKQSDYPVVGEMLDADLLGGTRASDGATVNFPGSIVRGTRLLIGFGVPDPSLGEDGNYYADANPPGSLYFKAGGNWLPFLTGAPQDPTVNVAASVGIGGDFETLQELVLWSYKRAGGTLRVTFTSDVSPIVAGVPLISMPTFAQVEFNFNGHQLTPVTQEVVFLGGTSGVSFKGNIVFNDNTTIKNLVQNANVEPYKFFGNAATNRLKITGCDLPPANSLEFQSFLSVDFSSSCTVGDLTTDTVVRVLGGHVDIQGDVTNASLIGMPNLFEVGQGSVLRAGASIDAGAAGISELFLISGGTVFAPATGSITGTYTQLSNLSPGVPSANGEIYADGAEKALVSTIAGQGLSEEQQLNARANLNISYTGIVLPPDGFGFTDYGFNIYRTPLGYTTDFDPTTMRLGGTNYYLKPSGNDASDGLSWATAKKSINVLIGALNAAPPAAATFNLEAGLYDYANAWGQNLPLFDLTLICASGYADNVMGAAATAAWTLSSGTMYSTTSASARAAVMDRTWFVSDEPNVYHRMTPVSSSAACAALLGSYFISGTTTYVNLWDGRVPDADVMLLSPTTSTTRSGDYRIYTEGVRFIGGVEGPFRLGSATTQKDVCFYRTQFAFGPAGNQAGGLTSVRAYPSKIYCVDVHAYDNYRDGLNYHNSGGSTTAADVIEINCTTNRNGWEGTEGSHNGSTIHDGGRIIRINGRSVGNENRNIHDVGNSQIWMLGCQAGFPRNQAGPTSSANFFVDSTSTAGDTEAWMENCKSLGGAQTDYGVFTDGKLHVRFCDPGNGRIISAGATLDEY